MEKPYYNDETIREFYRQYMKFATWQKAESEWYRNEFLSIPTTRSEAESAICNLYERSGHKAPSRFEWFLSPFDLISNLHFEIQRTQIEHDASHSIIRVETQVAKRESPSVLFVPLYLNPVVHTWEGEFLSEVFKWIFAISNGENDWMFDQLGQVGSSLLEALEESIADTNHSLAPYRYKVGLYDLWFIVEPGWIDWALPIENISEFFSMPVQVQNAEAIRRVLKTCAMVIPTEEVCFVSQKHSKVRHNEAGKLHSDTGLALEYADGWGIYARHGVRIPLGSDKDGAI